METLLKWMIWGYPIFGNTHIVCMYRASYFAMQSKTNDRSYDTQSHSTILRLFHTALQVTNISPNPTSGSSDNHRLKSAGWEKDMGRNEFCHSIPYHPCMVYLHNIYHKNQLNVYLKHTSCWLINPKANHLLNV